MYYDYFLIPIDLCQWVVQNKFSSPFGVYLALKSRCSGKLYLTHEVVCSIALELGVTNNTVNNNIKLLKGENWIGINKKQNLIYIRGFNNIKKQLGLKRKVGAILYKDEINQIKAFSIASVISNMITQGIRKKWCEKVLKKGRAVQFKHHFSKFHEISNQSISQVFNVGMGTASRYKSLACNTGYLNRKRNLEEVNIDSKSILLHNKYSNSQRAYINWNGKYYTQKPDLLSSNILLRKRR